MEGRIWGMLAAFLFVVVLSGGVAYTVSFEEVRKEYFNLQNQVEMLDKTIKSRQIVLDARLEKARSIAEQNARITNLERKALELDLAKTELLASIDHHAASAAATSRKLVETIEQVRRKASGTPLPELKLRSGEVLQGARIQTVTDADMSVLHSLGVTRLSPGQLPRDLVSKFKFGFVASHAPAASDEKKGDLSTPGATSSTGSALSADSAAVNKAETAKAMAKERKIQDLKDKTAKLDAQMTVARGNRDIWKKKADEYRMLHMNAEAQGRISSYLARVKDASSVADQFEAQITNLRAQIQLLQHEIVSLTKSADSSQ